jgi:hypothetical protein
MDIISAYTREQELADGVLVRLEDYLTQHGLPASQIVATQRAFAKKRFSLGELFITKAASLQLPPEIVLHNLDRHCYGDWGELCDEDRALNERGLERGYRLFSVYCPKRYPKFYILTDRNREATTIQLPGDY